MRRIPKKLKSDAIADAVCEIRFDCAENRDAPEVVVGMLASNPQWKAYRKLRLPEADIPDQIRRADPGLQSRPLLELASQDYQHRLLIGTRSIATIRKRPYPGWQQVQDDVQQVADHVFDTFEDVTIFRAGLRYINVIEKSKHCIDRLHDLRFKVIVDQKPINGEVNINYIVENETHRGTVRIATPGFIANLTPPDALGVIDIDTEGTGDGVFFSKESLMDWFVEARNFKNSIFFDLFEEVTLEKIVEQW